MRKVSIATITTLAAALLGGACGGGSGSPSGGGGNMSTGNAGAGGGGTGTAGATGGSGPTGDSFEPTPIGASWTYGTTDMGADGGTVTSTKTVTVEAMEPVPERAGITAARIHTLVPGEEDQMTWQAETATAIVRYRDDIYVEGTGTATLREYSVYASYKLRMDTTHLTTGATYEESYSEKVTEVTPPDGSSSTNKPFKWKVIDGSESVTVPAGTFTAIHLQKSNGNSNAIDKDYWFVRGVGKIKETAASTGRVEVLTAYQIP